MVSFRGEGVNEYATLHNGCITSHHVLSDLDVDLRKVHLLGSMDDFHIVDPLGHRTSLNFRPAPCIGHVQKRSSERGFSCSFDSIFIH